MEPPTTSIDTESSATFKIVGIGASAGGLNSLQCFLAALPERFNVALVFMQHLSPKHKSLLPDLLRSRWPNLAIDEVADGLAVRPGRLYLCPAGEKVRIHQGVFQVSPLTRDLFHLPIDAFMTALAEEAGDRAIAVVFSGAGTDGARGIQAIRATGGTVFVQDPTTAEFDSMPLAAIAAGQVDGVLTAEDIAREISALSGPPVATAGAGGEFSAEELEAFFRLIAEKTGHRFNHYKKSVVGRRINRRMFLRGIFTVKDYLEMISRSDSEAALLATDLMIGVTSFFRDRLAWKALRIGTIRKLAAAADDAPLRVWAPACATGEEAYSIAMLLTDELALAGRKREVQVFATDVSEPSLEKAREGKYPASIIADVPPDYMRKYFNYTEDGQAVVVGKEIRERVLFAKQDILTDPPFSRLDLIICRNLLIYLEPVAQEKCITIFHYALKNGGYLFLGNAESVGRKSTLFKSLGHKKCRIYMKIETKPSTRLPLSVPAVPERALPALTARQTPAGPGPSWTELIQESMLEDFAPPAVAINQNYDIVYHNGPTNRYLRQPRGAPTQNLLELLSEKLRNRVRGALYRATQEARPVSIRVGIPEGKEKTRQIVLRVSRLRDDLSLIVFVDKAGTAEPAEAGFPEACAIEETALHQLENELTATRTDLQSHIEQFKTLNEELQSSNEELQAANEELETSREELQSLNEELITVNSQLQGKVEEQEETNNDLNNFLASTNIPTVFLDQRFRVKRFTPAMARLVKLIPTDVGRPIADMSQENLGPDLLADARAVLDHLAPIKKELLINDTWYIRATQPYRTADNRIDGVVITYGDVSELKRIEEQTIHLASFPQENPNPVIEIDYSGKLIYHNPATQRILLNLGLDSHDVQPFLPADFATILHDAAKAEETTSIREVTIKDKVFAETIQLLPRFGVTRLYARDITGRKRAEEILRQSEERLNRSQEIAHLGSWELDLVHNTLAWSDEVYRIFGLAPQEFGATYEAFLEAVHPDDRAKVNEAYTSSVAEGRDIYDIEHRVVRKSTGEIRYVHERCQQFRDETGKIIRSVGMVHDVTGRKKAERERENTVEFLRLVNNSSNVHDLIKASAAFFQEKSGCEAVGIRLRQGDDYPYFETRGFSKDFLRTENSLCSRDQAGNVLLDDRRNPVLACLCGKIIGGQLDQQGKPFFSKGGSFWTNSTTALLSTAAGEELKPAIRNRCNREGYESVALIPIFLGREHLGLVQLNDRRQGRFTANDIASWERLAGHLAVALAKFQADESLQSSLQRFELLSQTASELLRASEPQKVVESLCRKVMQHLDCQVFFNFLVDESIGRLHLNACAGLPKEEARKIEWLDFGVAVCGCVARDGYRIVAEHIPTTPDERTELVKSYGIKAYACHPLLGPGGKTIGTLSFGTRNRETFNEDDLSLMKAVTDQVAVAMVRMGGERALLKRSQELETVNRELESFIYSVSHDLRAPLRHMSSFARFTMEDFADRLDEQGKDYLKRIRYGAETMSKLVEDLLYLSKISRQEIDRTHIDMSALACSLIAELRETHATRQVEVDIAEGLTAHADRRLIALALGNLLSNAWKFTARAQKARIEFGTMPQAGKTVFYVRDNGAGFDPKYKDKMFKPFERLHTDLEFEGTGIGLTIVERVVRRHGGKAWATGEKDKGATIYFTIE